MLSFKVCCRAHQRALSFDFITFRIEVILLKYLYEQFLFALVRFLLFASSVLLFLSCAWYFPRLFLTQHFGLLLFLLCFALLLLLAFLLHGL